MAPLSLQAPSRGSVVSLDSASAAPSRAVEVIASCTRGEAGTLPRRELTRPPLGVDKPTSPISPWPVENRFNGLSHGRLAQLVEHLVYTEGVGGSSPSPPIISSPRRAIRPRVRFDGRCRPSPAGSSSSGCCARSRHVLPRAPPTRRRAFSTGSRTTPGSSSGPGSSTSAWRRSGDSACRSSASRCAGTRSPCGAPRMQPHRRIARTTGIARTGSCAASAATG